MARYFAEQGIRVAGISRTEPEDLPDAVRWIRGDLTNRPDLDRIESEVRDFCAGKLDILINNAGKGIYATWEEMSEDDLRNVFELDFFAVVALTKRMLPMLAAAKGTVIDISSAAARIWVPCMGAYCAVKAAVAMFSNSLRQEVRQYGIRVLDVAPGQINTGFSSRSCGTRRPPDSPGSGGHTPQALAKAVYRAWKTKKERITYPRMLSAALFFIRAVIPSFYDTISRKLWKLNG